jgi:phage terminase large subunit-like protein
VVLRDWQQDILRGIYDTPTRRSIISFGRKNGKTAISAFLLLLHLVGPEAKANSQLFSAAQSREQAGILFRLASLMVRMSTELSQYVVVRDTAKELLCPELGTKYRALSAEASTAYGLSPVFVVHDELGQVKGPRSELYDALETASAAQQSPLSIIISTQAPTDADLLSQLIDKMAKNKLESARPEEKLYLYTTPDDADPFAVESIKLANPAFGDFQNPEEVMDQAATAKEMPSAENTYRNLILNQRVNMANPFVSRAVWEANDGEPDYTAFDRDVFVGLDLSFRHDLTAAVAVRKNEGKWHVWPTFFAPADGVKERSHRDRVPYDLWSKQGKIILTPGPTVEYEFVARWLADFCSAHGVREIHYDRWRMPVLNAHLSHMDMVLPLVEFGQGYKSMTPALDVLEAELVAKNLRHGGHPVLNMCAANAVAISDPAGGRKLDKSKSTGRIDGMVSLAMAIGGAAASLQEEPTKPLLMFTLG